MANSKNGRTWASWSGLYNTTAWKNLRAFKKEENPICEMCESLGRITVLDCVDHIVAITEENAAEMFLNYDNLQSLCDPCHSFKTNRDKGDKNHAYDGLVGQDLIDSLNAM